ncbi:MAG: hypothetical protein IPJ69_09295 [Deltaproteobacteria bacterium]|nr:MAG: hypothetical protein IPJ69_09295 [Deltaproteobacteria bacterium]
MKQKFKYTLSLFFTLIPSLLLAFGGTSTPSIDDLTRDPIVTSAFGTPVITPGRLFSPPHTCKEISDAMDYLSYMDDPSGGSEPITRTTHNMRQRRCVESSREDALLIRAFNRYFFYSSCTNGLALDVATQRACLARVSCDIASRIDDRVQMNAELAMRHDGWRRSAARHIIACAEAALMLRWVNSNCVIESSVGINEYTWIIPSTYEKGITYPETSCRAYYTYSGVEGESMIETDPPFFSIAADFRIDEFNPFISNRLLLRDEAGGALTPEEVSMFEEQERNCHTPQIPCVGR